MLSRLFTSLTEQYTISGKDNSYGVLYLLTFLTTSVGLSR